MTVEDLLEKVISSLETLKQDFPKIISWQYDDQLQNTVGNIELAITLLKAQEPRVLKISELWHMEHKPVYLERKNSRLYTTEPSIVLKTERSYIPSLGDSYILMRENKIHDKYWTCDYNKTGYECGWKQGYAVSLCRRKDITGREIKRVYRIKKKYASKEET
jgi:hypothetical protein